jgi:hypothetical protein
VAGGGSGIHGGSFLAGCNAGFGLRFAGAFAAFAAAVLRVLRGGRAVSPVARVDFGADLAMPRFPARPALLFLF